MNKQLRVTSRDFYYPLTHESIVKAIESSATFSIWDFNSSLGDTIMEKYESLYLKIVELTNVMIAKKCAGWFWIACSPEVASIFETACNFKPSDETHLPQGTNCIQFLGTINRRWTVYVDQQLEVNKVLIGCNCELGLEDPRRFASMIIENFAV